MSLDYIFGYVNYLVHINYSCHLCTGGMLIFFILVQFHLMSLKRFSNIMNWNFTNASHVSGGDTKNKVR